MNARSQLALVALAVFVANLIHHARTKAPAGRYHLETRWMQIANSALTGGIAVAAIFDLLGLAPSHVVSGVVLVYGIILCSLAMLDRSARASARIDSV